MNQQVNSADPEKPSQVEKTAADSGARRRVSRQFFWGLGFAFCLVLLGGVGVGVYLRGEGLPGIWGWLEQSPAISWLVGSRDEWQAVSPEIQVIRSEALAVAERLRRRFPGSAEAMCVYGLVLSHFGKLTSAVRAWKRSLALFPGYPDACYSLGEEARLRGQLEEASSWFRRALETDPNRADIRLSYAKVLSQLSKTEEAVTQFAAHLELSPESVEGWFGLGQVYAQQGRLHEAKQCHLRALAIDPKAKPVYYALATVCDRLGHKGEAARYRREFAALETADRMPAEGRRHPYDDLKAAREALVATYVEAGKVYAAYEDPSSAEEHWKRAAALNPQEIQARLALVSLYERQGQWGEALLRLEELSQAHPEQANFHLALGMKYVQLRRLEDAERSFRRFVELRPERFEGWIALAQVYAYENRNLEQAYEAARKAVQLQPTAANYQMLAQICERRGDLQAAIAAAKRAMELEPRQQEIRQLFARLQSKWRQSIPNEN